MNLRLESYRMNPICMETFANSLGQTIEVRNDITVENHVRSGEGFGLIQAPDVEFVDGEDAGDFLQVVFDVVVVHALGGTLEEDEAGVFDCFEVSDVPFVRGNVLVRTY
jgi:hypothetical protein